MFKPIPNFKGYEIDQIGNVFSRRHAKKKLKLKPRYLRGYVRYCLYDDYGKPNTRQAHRLVWEAFVGEIPPNMQINHINGIKHDNRLTNLEVVTMSDNLKHRYSVLGLTGVRGSKNNLSKLTEEKVLIILSLLKSGESHASIARKFGISRPAISMISAKKTWPHINRQ